MPTPYAKKIAQLAEAEFDNFHGYHETTSKMASRIKTYWAGIGWKFLGVNTAWSAVFVSYFVKIAGASSSEFTFSPRHGEFVFDAIKNGKSSTGVFRGWSIKSYAPKIGDIIHNNRNGHSYDFSFAAANKQYESHTAIVVEEGMDGNGRYVRTIGGNESDTVGQRIVRLSTAGLIVQPKADPTRFISVIQNLK